MVHVKRRSTGRIHKLAIAAIMIMGGCASQPRPPSTPHEMAGNESEAELSNYLGRTVRCSGQYTGDVKPAGYLEVGSQVVRFGPGVDEVALPMEVRTVTATGVLGRHPGRKTARPAATTRPRDPESPPHDWPAPPGGLNLSTVGAGIDLSGDYYLDPYHIDSVAPWTR
jgi:hypothetical protein